MGGNTTSQSFAMLTTVHPRRAPTSVVGSLRVGFRTGRRRSSARRPGPGPPDPTPRASRVSTNEKNRQQSCSARASAGEVAEGDGRIELQADTTVDGRATRDEAEHPGPVLEAGGHGVDRQGAGDRGRVVRARRLVDEGDHRRCRDRRAAAAIVACPVRTVLLQRGGRAVQLGGERGELDEPGLGLGQLRLHDRAQPVLDRAALAAVPGDRQVGDLLEGAPQLLGPGDEGEAVQRPVVVDAVPAAAALRRGQEADLLVVAQRGGREPAPAGHVGDAKSGGHPSNVDLQVDMKVKRQPRREAGDGASLAFVGFPSWPTCRQMTATRP